MPTITGEIVALTKYNKVASAKIKNEDGKVTDVRYWMSAPFADQMAEGATVTLDLEKRPQRDDPDKFDTFVASCNGVSEKGGGGNRPGGGGGGGRPQENPKDRAATMLTSYAKDLIVNVEGMTPADAAEMVATMFLIIRAKIGQVVNT